MKVKGNILPQHKSCKKRVKTSAIERYRNRAVRSAMSKAIKSYKESTDKAEAEKGLNNVLSLIDKAARKNVIHKNKAGRDKSKMVAHLARLSATPKTDA